MDEVSAISPSPYPPSTAGGQRHVTPPVTEGPASDAPRRTSAPVMRLPAAMPTPPDDVEDPRDAFPELSGEVSAVIGSPAAGAPRSARMAVSVQHRRLESPDEDDDILDDRTIVARRRGPRWQLLTATGQKIELRSDVAILGRRPAADSAFPNAQLIALDDDTRTVSKSHARLERRADGWHITDLHSTNGVLLRSLLGTEMEAAPGTSVAAGERFLLGDAELRLAQLDD